MRNREEKMNRGDRPLSRHLFRALFVLIPAGVLLNVGLTLFLSDRVAFGGLGSIQTPYLLGAMAMALVPWGTHVLRMKIWTSFFHRSISVCSLFRVALGTTLGRAISPTVLGGGPVKVGLLVKNGVKPARAVTLSLIGSIEDGVLFIVGLLVAVVVAPPEPLFKLVSHVQGAGDSFLYLLVLPVLFFVGLLLWYFRTLLDRLLSRLPYYQKLRDKLFDTCSRIRSALGLIIRHGKSRFAFTVLLALIHWTCWFGMAYVLLKGLGISASPFYVFLLQVLVMGGTVLVPTPGGLGGAEALFLLMFGGLVTGEHIGVLTAAWRFVTFYEPVLLAAFLFLLFFVIGYNGRHRGSADVSITS